MMPNRSSTKQRQIPARRFTLIDLFSGCGGLSLGLEMAGFRTLLFSELNKDAAATYASNRMDADLIHYGDIAALTEDRIKAHVKQWKAEGIKDVDLVTGGPPCQGYSKIGHRRTFRLTRQEIPSNQLFKQMVRVVATIRPRAFLFENVSGLLTSRWTPSGEKGEIFRDVMAEFLGIDGYVCRWELVHARDYGVPQNRPRILVVGIRSDLGLVCPPAEQSAKTLIKPSAIRDGLLPAPNRNSYPHLADLLGDLADPDFKYGGTTTTYLKDPSHPVQEDMRRRRDGSIALRGDPVTEHEISNHSPSVRRKFAAMLKTGKIPVAMQTRKFAQRVLPRRWDERGPNITATSLPDDFVHYELARTLSVREWARLQTFPDWYRFAGSRTTGGRRRAGDPKAGIWDRDVPKYTQIGNAVPVNLANAVGLHLAKLLGSH